MTTCPKCRRVQYYVCGNKKCVCYARVPKGKKSQEVLRHDAIRCPYCGFTQHLDYWTERDMQNSYNTSIKMASVPRK